MTKLSQIKRNIGEILKSLKRQEIIGDYRVDDYKKSIFRMDLGKFPVAVLATPTVSSEAATNRDNLRTYTFEIIVLSRLEDVNETNDIEELIEKILNEFDNDPTLKGGTEISAADGGVEPSTTTPQVIADGGNNYVVFSVIIRVRALRTLDIQ